LSDFILPFLEQLQNSTNLVSRKAEIRGQLDLRLHPELRFCLSRLHMDVYSSLFAREEEHPNPALPKNGGTHFPGAANVSKLSGERSGAERGILTRFSGHPMAGLGGDMFIGYRRTISQGGM
jgi:hypothetical protein